MLLDQGLIRQTFPHFAHDMQAVVHARRCGAISVQELGMYFVSHQLKAGLLPFESHIATSEVEAIAQRALTNRHQNLVLKWSKESGINNFPIWWVGG